VYSQRNNICGTLNVLFAMKRYVPDAHLVKLGTMGEYGTPNIDIEEGFITIEHNGRSDRLPFPKQAGSFYHWSKVHDSGNIMFACRLWGLRSTDLNQGIVYGIETEDATRAPDLRTSFHYDETFGTVLNRFCVQAVAEMPLTVYGKGTQRRAALNIRDTLQCVELSVDSPPNAGEYRVFNQFTEVFSIMQFAETVQDAARKLGMNVEIDHLHNPRVEAEEHYYNPVNSSLLALGLKPRLLSEELVNSMLVSIAEAKDHINPAIIPPSTQWRQD
jgi:UDP-sulfoquinovose synthase